MCHPRMSLAVHLSDFGGDSCGQDTHLGVSAPTQSSSLDKHKLHFSLKDASPYPKQDLISPFSSLECFENLCLSNALEKHEKNFLNARSSFFFFFFKSIIDLPLGVTL